MDELNLEVQSEAASPPTEDRSLRMAEIAQRYDGFIQKLARAKLNPTLRRHGDSVDFSQSVLVSLWKQIRNGNFLAADSAILCGFVRVIVRRKFYDLYQGKLARDNELVSLDSNASLEVVDHNAIDPARAAEARDLWNSFRESMSAEERSLVDFRDNGASWEDIALTLGGTADAHRMRYNRLLVRCRSLKPET